MDYGSRHKRRKRLFYLVVTFIISAFILQSLLSLRSQKIISPIPDNLVVQPKAVAKSPQTQTFNFFKKKKDPDDLQQKIDAVINDTWNDYSLIVEDYTSDFSVKNSEGEIFVAASINKAPILAVLYYLAGKGEIDLDKDITVQRADIQDYGTGSIRYEGAGSVYSVKTLAKLMIKQSDNTAAYILANHIVGFDQLKSVLSEWNLTQTDMVANKTSNQDIAKVFRMMYEGKVTDQANTQEMLSFLKDTDHETRLPANLPDTTTTYHKIGTEVGIIHDAGIVTDGKSTYYIGIFTNGTEETEATDQLFAKVSKLVYDYMK